MYCLSTDSGAPPMVRMQYLRFQNTGLFQQYFFRGSAHPLRSCRLVTILRLFTKADGSTRGVSPRAGRQDLTCRFS